MSLENETRAEFAARMDKEGNSRADMIAAYYGLLQWYRGKDDELQEAEAEVARLRAERDAAREEVERLREALSALATDEMESVVVANDNARRWKALMMKQSVYTGMALDERDAADAEVDRLRAERDAAREEVERLRGKLDFAQKSIPFDFVVGAGQLVQERDDATAAAARWRNRARFWRRVADQTSMWTGGRFYKRVLQLSRRWRREGERHD